MSILADSGLATTSHCRWQSNAYLRSLIVRRYILPLKKAKKKHPIRQRIRCFFEKKTTYFFGAIEAEKLCRAWLALPSTLLISSVQVLTKGSIAGIVLFSISACCCPSLVNVSTILLMDAEKSLLVSFAMVYIVWCCRRNFRLKHSNYYKRLFPSI